MTFDEAATKVENLVGDLNIPLGVEGTLLDIIEILSDEYAPTVEMTKNDRDILLHNLEKYPFDVFIVSISMSDKEIFGLPANKEFKGLSIEDLMRAWLHPETIKIVDE